MRAAGLREWLKAKDPSFVAIKRAARVTLAACAAFYFSLYVLDDTQMATFASFGCIALGALSEVTGNHGSGPKHTVLRYWPASILVTLGTMLAINTWAAVAGMLVIGFVIAYAGVGGPRVVGAANGLQLLYILPSFPPYLPDALGSRLIGLVLAVGLLAIADRLLWPPPVPTPFRQRLAAAIHAVRDRLVALLESDGDRHAPAQSDAQSDTGGAIGLRLSRIPPLERPTGPGRRDRAAMEATTILGGLEARVAALTELTEQGATAHAEGMHLLSVTAQSLGQSAEALDRPPDGDGPDPDSAPVEAALSEYVQWREALSHTTAVDRAVRMRLRFAVAAEELSVWTRDLAMTVRIMQGKRVPEIIGYVDCRTVLVRQPLCTLAVVHAIPWTLHSPLGLLSKRNPIGCRARCCAAGSRCAGSVPRVLDAAGNTDLDAHLSSDHTCRRRSRISGNSRWRIGRGAGTGIGRRGFDGV